MLENFRRAMPFDLIFPNFHPFDAFFYPLGYHFIYPTRMANGLDDACTMFMSFLLAGSHVEKL